MLSVHQTSIYRISDYSQHLKNLTEQDKISRFGYLVNNHTIDQLILNMCYNPKDHELWYAEIDDRRIGWGHMAKNNDGSYEMAVSVDKDYQRQGVANKLIGDMILWAKLNQVSEVYMHCIEDNHVIQHLARKHNLKLRERSQGERTASMEVPDPTFFEVTGQKLKEQKEIVTEIGKLQKKLTKLWLDI